MILMPTLGEHFVDIIGQRVRRSCVLQSTVKRVAEPFDGQPQQHFDKAGSLLYLRGENRKSR